MSSQQELSFASRRTATRAARQRRCHQPRFSASTEVEAWGRIECKLIEQPVRCFVEPVSRRGSSPTPIHTTDSQVAEQGSPTSPSRLKRDSSASAPSTFSGRPPKRSRSFVIESPGTSPQFDLESASPTPIGEKYEPQVLDPFFNGATPVNDFKSDSVWTVADSDLFKELMIPAQADEFEPLPLATDLSAANWAMEDAERINALLAELKPIDLAANAEVPSLEQGRQQAAAELDSCAPLRLVGDNSSAEWQSGEIEFLKSLLGKPAETQISPNRADRGFNRLATPEAASNHQGQPLDHDAVLKGYKFTPSQVSRLNDRPNVLAFLANRYSELNLSLPSLTRGEFVELGSSNGGCAKLHTLLEVSSRDIVRTSPLSFTDQQLAKIAARDRSTLLAIETAGLALAQAHGVSGKEVATLALNAEGGLLLQEVYRLFSEPQGSPLPLSRAQVLAVAAPNDGLKNLQTLFDVGPVLLDQTHGFRLDQVVAIASQPGGARALMEVTMRLPKLQGAGCDLTNDQVCAIASRPHSADALGAFRRRAPRLTSAHFNFSRDQVLAIACRRSGASALKLVENHFWQLHSAPVSLTREQIVSVATATKGDKALREAAHIATLVAMKHAHLGWTADNVMQVMRTPRGADRLASIAYELERSEYISVGQFQAFLNQR